MRDLEAELRACPFCGGKPRIYTRGGAWGVKCTGKDHFTQTYGKTEADAVAAWNRRDDGPELSRLREAEKRYKAALEPFAKYMADGMDLNNIGAPLPGDQGVGWVYLTYGDFRAALRALQEGNNV